MANSEPPDSGVIDLRTDVPHPARVYDYWLGGKDNFAADREAAEAVIAVRPTVVRDIRANRAFLRRAVRWLASEAGVGQFLDIGTGLPTGRTCTRWSRRSSRPPGSSTWTTIPSCCLMPAPCSPAARRARPTMSMPTCASPEEILAEAAKTLDFSQPVALLLVGILHLISDDEDPNGIVARLMENTLRRAVTWW